MRERPPIMTLSDTAAARIKALTATRDDGASLRIGVRKGGCSGMSYTMEFSDRSSPMDEVVEAKGVRVVIDAQAMMFLLGTEMDYVESTLSSGFVFNNPNEKGRCGCGESFHV